MQIISLIFFAFVATVFLGMYLCGKLVCNEGLRVKLNKWILLIFSYLFVLYADYRFAMVLAGLTIIVWLCAKNKKYIKFGILAAVLALGFFKYTNFFMESFGRLLGRTDYTALHLMLPLGISFYTFSAIGYLVDVKRENLMCRPLLDVAVYLSFFPKITSGPIQKSKDFFLQLDSGPKVGWETFSVGIQIFCFGLFKKIVLADRLSVFVDQVFDTPRIFSSATVLLAVLAYALQIYFDFSGYSDMAIGTAAVLGIRLPRNFNLPYLSHNVTEFWKRWHITLSSWLQEYVYFSLGGNRKGKIRTYWNLILTMVIGGIWHGPSWTYIVWGLLHGLALAVHKIWMKLTGSQSKQHGLMSNVVSILVTFGFTSFCWVFFRAESTEKAFQILKQIVCLQAGIWHPYVWLFAGVVVLGSCSVMALVKSKERILPEKRKNQSYINGYYLLLDLTKFWHLVLFFVFCGLILGLAHTGGSPFIYGAY